MVSSITPGGVSGPPTPTRDYPESRQVRAGAEPQVSGFPTSTITY